MNKKFLSILLCIAMLISSLSIFASALSFDVEIDLGDLFDPVEEEDNTGDDNNGNDSTDDDNTDGDDNDENDDANVGGRLPDDDDGKDDENNKEDKDDKDDKDNKNDKDNNKGNNNTKPKDDKEVAEDENDETEPGTYGKVDLPAIVNSLYEGIKEDEMPMLMTMPLDEESFEYFSFVSYEGLLEGAVSEPMMGSIAHSLVLVKCPTLEKAQRVAAEIKANCDPRKWICVEADIVEVISNQNIVMLLMTTQELGIADRIIANFASLNESNIYDIKSEEIPEEEEDPSSNAWTNPYSDVKDSDWYFDTVRYASQTGLMNGVSDTEFAPAATLTRAMLVTILYRTEGSPAVYEESKFTDVTDGSWYADAVIWAAENGIVNGVSETEFAPNANITREQIATIIHRYAKANGYDVSVGENTNILSYEDADTISYYAVEALQYTAGSGIMKGKTESTLNPKDNATRAEAATVIVRFIQADK